MKTFVFILLVNLITIGSIFKCSDADHVSKTESATTETGNEKDEIVSYQPDTLQIEFDGGIHILWDNVNDMIIEDENYHSLTQKPININIVNAITDTTFVSNNVCSKNSSLKKGDIAFILLMISGHIAIANDFHIQICTKELEDCPYFDGVLDWVEEDREHIKETLLDKYFK